MRKRIITPVPRESAGVAQDWLAVETLARVEVTSEDPAHPVESALTAGAAGGWRAAQPGKQTVRLIFDRPQSLNRILLIFEEREAQRTQEFVLRWSSDGGNSYRDIVRQQWNFSPPGTTKEVEDHRVGLLDVTALELEIVPDHGRGEARASLEQLRLA
ncbi:MAG: carbohydrate-binding protein [Terriglobia bacterium]